MDVVADEAGLHALHDAWNAIAAQRRDLSVFAFHEWFDAAWQWRKESCRLHVLTWTDRGRVRAILPMSKRTVRSQIGSVDELSLLTVPDTQLCDMLVAEPEQASAADAFASHLLGSGHDWDVMRLAFLRPSSTIATVLAPAMAEGRCGVACDETPANPFVSLQGSWGTYYGGRSRRLKKAANLAANRLAKAGVACVDWLEPGSGDTDRREKMIESIVEVSENSWKAETGTTLGRPGPQAFIRRLSTLAAKCGWLSIWTLVLDGQVHATEYQLIYGGNVHALRSDFRAGQEDISPGSHLNRFMLERLFGRGYQRYYMGPGNNAYKFRWAEDADPQVTVTIYSPSFAGRVLGTWERRLKPQLSAIRRRLVASVRPTERTNDD